MWVCTELKIAHPYLEREREGGREGPMLCYVCMCVYVFVLLYVISVDDM